MNPHPWFCLVALPALVAQQPSPPRVPDPPRDLSPSLDRVQRELKGKPGLMLAGGGDAAHAQRLNRLLALPPMEDLGIGLRMAPLGSRLERDCQARLKPPQGPWWFIVAPDLRVLARGEGTPEDGVALAEALRKAGIRSQLAVLEDHLAAHPTSVEALGRKAALLGRKAVWDLAAVGKHSRTALTDEDDARIFGAYAKALDTFLAHPAFTAGLQCLEGNLRLPIVGGSPLLKAAAQRHVPSVEAALRRSWNLSEWRLWELWMALRELVPSERPVGFVASLRYVDGIDMGFQPKLMAMLLKQARQTGEWRELAQVGRALWEQTRHPGRRWYGQGFDFRREWDTSAGLLVEALLNVGRTSEAGEVLQAFLDWSQMADASAWAAELARACGASSAAAAWAALKPGTGSTPRTMAQAPERDEGTLPGLVPPGEAVVLLRLEDRPGSASYSGQRSAWDRAWSALKQAWVGQDRQLRTVPVRPDSPVGKALRAREGWDEQLRWALMDVKGRVLESGEQVPSHVSLEQTLRQHGHPVLHERLDALLAEQPDYIPAIREHLALHLAKAGAEAERQVAGRHGLATAWQAARAERLRDPRLVARMLEDAQAKGGAEEVARRRAWLAKEVQAPRKDAPAIEDPMEASWQEAGRLLSRLIQIPDWARVPVGFPIFLPSRAGSSPAFLGTLKALQPVLEAQLLDSPGSNVAWRLYLQVVSLTGTSPLELMDRVVWTPGGLNETHPNWPSRELLETLGRQQCWQAVLDRVESRWRDWLERPTERPFSGFMPAVQAALNLKRPQLAAAWVERYLAVEPGLATQIFDIAAQAAGSAGARDLEVTWRVCAAEQRSREGNR